MTQMASDVRFNAMNYNRAMGGSAEGLPSRESGTPQTLPPPPGMDRPQPQNQMMMQPPASLPATMGWRWPGMASNTFGNPAPVQPSPVQPGGLDQTTAIGRFSAPNTLAAYQAMMPPPQFMAQPMTQVPMNAMLAYQMMNNPMMAQQLFAPAQMNWSVPQSVQQQATAPAPMPPMQTLPDPGTQPQPPTAANPYYGMKGTQPGNPASVPNNYMAQMLSPALAASNPMQFAQNALGAINPINMILAAKAGSLG